MSRERFVFGVPLIARSAAADWRRVDDLLEMTLRSVLAQTASDFTLFMAGHDAPESWSRLTRGDRRFRFLRADWDPATPTRANDDGGAKKHMIKQVVRRSGGGLLMFLDADDLIDCRVVDTARSTLSRRHVGGIVAQGIVLDLQTLNAISLPDPRVYQGGFVELCGSSTVARIEPDSPDPVRRDPNEALGSHHRWPEAASLAGVPVARLAVSGAYIVNTEQNHSETHGPHAGWRRDLNAAVAREGRPLDAEAAAGLGVGLDLLRAKSARLRHA